MSYVIPVSELTLTDIKTYKATAIEAGIARALVLGIAATREELIVREALPQTDFGNAAGIVGWANETYITPALVANTIGFAYGTGVVPTLGARKVAVFYKIAVEEATPQIAAVYFRLGLGGTTTLAAFPIETAMYNGMETSVYMSEPVVYSKDEAVFIQQMPRAAVAAGQRLQFGCFIVEPVGSTVS